MKGHEMNMAEKKMAWINEQIDNGRDVHVRSMTKVTLINAKVMARWAKAGHDAPIKVRGDSLVIMERGKYVSADHCELRAI